MTQNANGISLKKSKRFTELNGVKFPNLPSADKLVEGELAINYAEGLETISTKNESGNVVTFSSDDYYSEKKLGSGFTGINSAITVTDIIDDCAYIGDYDGSAVIADFDPRTDTVWKKAQVLSSAEKEQVQQNIGVREWLNNLTGENFFSAVATQQTQSVTELLPATGSTDTVYRVGKWDGTQYNEEYYSDYAWDGTQYVQLNKKSSVGEVFDITEYKAGAKFTDISGAIGIDGANIPMSVRKGGMCVKFVNSETNTYSMYILKAMAFSTDASDWAKCEDTSYKVTVIDENSTDDEYPSAKAVYDAVKREIVNVVATSDSGSVETTAVLKIKVDGSVIAQGIGNIQAALTYGVHYTVEAERIYDYLTPQTQIITAGLPTRTINMEYTYIPRDTITLNQTVSDELTMITGDVQGDVIKAIRAASHLYLGKQTAEGNQLICQLSDSNGTKYYDGSTAVLTGSQGDQWMKLPVFYWKITPIGNPDSSDAHNQYSFSFAFDGEPDPTWHKWEGDKNLLGAKKMYVTSGKGYSRSNVIGTANFTQATGVSYATARGTGYSLVTWEWHWMMCVLFYAWYGRMNSQLQCGYGSNINTRTLGTKDSLGMTDTTSSSGNADNTKFWGIENWWGDIAEWIGNITSNNYVVTITDMNTKVNRTVSGWKEFGGTGGYGSRFKITQQMDFIPTASNGSTTTYYCDWVNGNTGSRVVHRSSDSAYANGGVAYVNSSNGPSYASASLGSRLAFNGTIVEAESVEAYKAASPLI